VTAARPPSHPPKDWLGARIRMGAGAIAIAALSLFFL